jgi:hypothetical protein
MNAYEDQLSLKENKIFKDYHEARLKRIKYQIEEGIYTFDEGEQLLNQIDLDDITPEELAANQDLQEYADAIKKR